jgi:hypothetical protein
MLMSIATSAGRLRITHKNIMEQSEPEYYLPKKYQNRAKIYNDTVKTRKINVRMWVKAWGQEIEKIIEIEAPPVSNMPCPDIQRKNDECLAKCAVHFGVETGFEILSVSN